MAMIMIGIGPKKKSPFGEREGPGGEKGFKFGLGKKEEKGMEKGGDLSSTVKGQEESGMKEEKETKGPLSEAGKKVMAAGKSMFHDQGESCANCEYFDSMGGEGNGECKKGVPEADFSKSDPSSSWCRFYEGTNPEEESSESPMSEEKEEVENAL